MTKPIRLAILGCGAITRSEHIPSVLAHPDVELIALVDTDLARANGLIQARGLSCKAVAD
jgi:predicted dehydrogenase